MKKWFSLFCAAVAGVLFAGKTQSGDKTGSLPEKFSFSPVFSSHMVLQREKPIRFSGKGTPGANFTITFAGVTRSGSVAGNGTWQAEFPAMTAGGPWTLSAESAGIRVKMEDILIGEVWFCSGQSNMAMPVTSKNPYWGDARADEILANADCPRLRLANALPIEGTMPPILRLEEHPLPIWRRCDGESLASFSACAYHFGKKLVEDLHVPVGLIACAKGGTDIRAWISPEKFQEYGEAVITDPAEEHKRQHEVKCLKWREFVSSPASEKIRAWLPQFDALGAVDPAWLSCDFDDSAWEAGKKEENFLAEPCRTVFRLTFTLDSSWQGKAAELSLGVICDMDAAFCNGVSIGATGLETPGYWAAQRRYSIPADILKAGKNVVAVIADNHFCTGFANFPAFSLAAEGKTVSPELRVCRKDRFHVPQEFPGRPDVPSLGLGFDNDDLPTTLYCAMTALWTAYTIRGFLWYQGCNNAGQCRYYQYHKMLIDDWREKWGEKDLPFLLVQLAPFYANSPQKRYSEAEIDAMDYPEFSPYALIREIQSEMPRVRSNTGFVCIMDAGDASDIHPHDKQTPGRRLAQKAEKMVYGKQEVICDGPEVESIRFEYDRVILTFRNAEGGLVTSDGKPPKAFAIAGPEGVLKHADARIEGNTVIVSAVGVIHPQVVRYAYTGFCTVNLTNRAGLPAVPWRSDKMDYPRIFGETGKGSRPLPK